MALSSEGLAFKAIMMDWQLVSQIYGLEGFAMADAGVIPVEDTGYFTSVISTLKYVLTNACTEQIFPTTIFFL